jgi:SAM-dependent methyltransferase
MSSEIGAGTRGPAAAEGVMGSVVQALQWAVDRMLSVGYGVVWDAIYERFRPYQDLQAEVLGLVADSVAKDAVRREVQVLEVGCGPGNFTFVLAEAGYSAIGLESYAALVELAREKRRAKRLANLAFRHGELAAGGGIRDASFDVLVSIHGLYVHPEPLTLLREARRVLKPGGHLVLVNPTRHVGQWSTFREIKAREGLRSALASLLWLLPNSIFELARKRIGPHYWDELQFADNLKTAGFSVLETRRTFLNDASVLVWARRDVEES